MPSVAQKSRHKAGSRSWSRLGDEALLDLRMCDLGLKADRPELKRRIKRLYSELERKGIGFKPHAWLSTEWFSPDGVPGIAIPFYLAHPRLAKLEKSRMLEVEGGSETQCARILRHEAGHCIDTAYRLHRRKRWREVFGSFTTPYPLEYQPKPGSRSYVLHLDSWYAQAHPAEDFAETFAVWLTPNARWRTRYKGWPALRKLEYVDELMKEIAGTPPAVRSRRKVEPLSQSRTTLREHYRRKRLYYADEWPEFYDTDLRKLFSDDPRYRARPTAASFLRGARPQIREAVARWTGTHTYTVDQVLRDMIDRCKELKLRLAVPQRLAKTEAMMMVAVQTMSFLHTARRRVVL
jgi:Putative zinc-binding metallo-peptidase